MGIETQDNDEEEVVDTSGLIEEEVEGDYSSPWDKIF